MVFDPSDDLADVYVMHVGLLPVLKVKPNRDLFW